MIIFNEIEPPVKEKHVCWNVRKDSDIYILEEIVESYYKHPDAPDLALIVKYDKKRIADIKRSSIYYAPIHLFVSASKNIDIVIDKIRSKI